MPTIAVVCVFGVASGQMLGCSIRSVLLELGLGETAVKVTDLADHRVVTYDAAFCLEALEAEVRNRQISATVYTVSSVLDKARIKECILDLTAGPGRLESGRSALV